MFDVAELAGVSAQTVSRTLRGYQHVSERTRKKVLDAVAELGYRRNAAAAALASGRSSALGVVGLDHGSFRFDVMSGIVGVAAQRGYTVNMATTATLESKDVTRAISRLLDQSVAGIVLAFTFTEIDAAAEALIAEVPTIAVGGDRKDWADAIALDKHAGTGNATRYLLDLGHETVTYVGGLRELGLADAWRAELERAGRPIPDVLEGDWTPTSGYALGRRIADDPTITAVLVASDEMAFGVMRGLQEAGRSIPGEISVMGAADSRLSPWVSPPLSSVEEPLMEIGARAARYLLHRIGQDEGPFVSEKIVPRLIIRASTAAPAVN
ncbi:LacI family DNA-binding transcriptional regulator [Luethyella okanaganae]|uniref:LacI family DNA-binding transcriptional regulator n=1 Tax=Luethyella okanaganae TaxID=69372 RepID=A0ABW1VFE3_9MICO